MRNIQANAYSGFTNNCTNSPPSHKFFQSFKSKSLAFLKNKTKVIFPELGNLDIMRSVQ